MPYVDERDTIRAVIVEQGYKQAVIAKKVKLTPAKLSATLNKKRELKARELLDLCGILNIDPKALMQTTATPQRQPVTATN